MHFTEKVKRVARNRIVKYIAVAVVAAMALVMLHRNSYNQLPTSKHTWAQSDWYALSLGFLQNGRDFLHPQTFQLNLQFPAAQPLAEPTGITAVDFPVHPWVVSLVMHLLQTSSPVVYRTYSLLLCLIGLFFLYQTVRKVSASTTIAATITGFMALLPSFVYYSNGFLPTFNALSLFFVGMWFMVQYVTQKSTPKFVAALFFMMLAALTRLPFATHLIALSLALAVQVFNGNKKQIKPLLLAVAALMPVFGYYLYNRYLSAQYGSVFLNHTMHPRSVGDFFEFLFLAIRSHAITFMPLPHLFMLILCMWVAFKAGLFKNLKLKTDPIVQFIAIDLSGMAAYAFLAWRQLYAHDYYLFDIFMVPLLFVVLWIFSRKPVVITGQTKLLAVLFLLSAFYIAFQSQSILYYEPIAKASGVEADFSGAGAFVAENGVAPNQKILILPSTGESGFPLLLMNRKGYVVRSDKPAEIEQALALDYDFILVQNRLIERVFSLVPDFLIRVEPVADNGNITLYKRRK